MDFNYLKAVCLFIILSGHTHCDLLPIDTYGAKIYASSIAVGSKAVYAVDSDFENPTCFYSSVGSAFKSEYHWLAVDLGSVTHKIAEVRLTILDADNKHLDLYDIDVFIAQRINTDIVYIPHNQTVDRILPWETYEFCNNSKNNLLTRTGAVINCDKTRTGRWVLLRRKTRPLAICLLSVYVDSVGDECFHSFLQTNPAQIMQAFEFRLERHVSLTHCRQSCLETPICQALKFIQQSRLTGSCHLLQQFEKNASSSEAPIIYCAVGQNCLIEENLCHRGHVLSLVPLKTEINGTEYLEWEIEVPSALKDTILQVQHLYAVQMKGDIECLSRDCDTIKIHIRDTEGIETLCGPIDTTLVSVLGKFTVYCQENKSTAAAGYIALKKVNQEANLNLNRAVTEPKILATGGYVYFTDITQKNAAVVKPYIMQYYEAQDPEPVSPETFINPTHSTGDAKFADTTIIFHSHVTEETDTTLEAFVISSAYQTEEEDTTLKTTDAYVTYRTEEELVATSASSNLSATSEEYMISGVNWNVIIIFSLISLFVIVIIASIACSRKCTQRNRK